MSPELLAVHGREEWLRPQRRPSLAPLRMRFDWAALLARPPCRQSASCIVRYEYGYQLGVDQGWTEVQGVLIQPELHSFQI